jgi:hypothetical protein
MKIKRCYRCGKEILGANQIYCGHQKIKGSCAYNAWLEKIKEWNKTNKLKLRKYWNKASMKYKYKNWEQHKRYCREYYWRKKSKLLKELESCN